MTSFGSCKSVPYYPKFCLVKKGKCLSIANLYSVNFINILVILVLRSLSIYILLAVDKHMPPHNIRKRPQKQYQSVQPVTSLEWPFNSLRTEGGSDTVHTVKVPSDAPYASRSELMCPNFKTVTAH